MTAEPDKDWVEVAVIRLWSAVCTDLWQGMIDGTPVGCGSWEWVWGMIEQHTHVMRLNDAREVRIRIDRKAENPKAS